MFEVQDLRFATLATVSRCGMVWFSEDVLTLDMIFENFLLSTRTMPIDDGDEGFNKTQSKVDISSPTMQVLCCGVSCHANRVMELVISAGIFYIYRGKIL